MFFFPVALYATEIIFIECFFLKRPNVFFKKRDLGVQMLLPEHFSLNKIHLEPQRLAQSPKCPKHKVVQMIYGKLKNMKKFKC